MTTPFLVRRSSAEGIGHEAPGAKPKFGPTRPPRRARSRPIARSGESKHRRRYSPRAILRIRRVGKPLLCRKEKLPWVLRRKARKPRSRPQRAAVWGEKSAVRQGSKTRGRRVSARSRGGTGRVTPAAAGHQQADQPQKAAAWLQNGTAVRVPCPRDPVICGERSPRPGAHKQRLPEPVPKGEPKRQTSFGVAARESV